MVGYTVLYWPVVVCSGLCCCKGMFEIRAADAYCSRAE